MNLVGHQRMGSQVKRSCRKIRLKPRNSRGRQAKISGFGKEDVMVNRIKGFGDVKENNTNKLFSISRALYQEYVQ